MKVKSVKKVTQPQVEQMNVGFACESDMQVERWRCRTDYADAIRLVYGAIESSSRLNKLWSELHSGAFYPRRVKGITASCLLTEKMMHDCLSAGVAFLRLHGPGETGAWNAMINAYVKVGEKAVARGLEFAEDAEAFIAAVAKEGSTSRDI